MKLNKNDKKYVIMHVVEAFGAGVGHSIQQIYTSYSEDLRGVVVHGYRDLNLELKRNAGHVEFIPWSAKREISIFSDGKALFELISIMRKYRPSVVHAHSSKGGLHGRVAALLLGIPCVYTPHSYAFLRSDIGLLSRFLFKLVERCLAPFAMTIACGIEEYVYARALSRNVTVIENGVNVKRFSPADMVTQERKETIVLCVGRITPQKDFEMFKTLAQLESFKNVKFLWASGEGTVDYSVSTNLEVLASRTPEQMADIYRKASIYISTSLWEGLSRAVLEAAASGLPLVLRKCPGNRELLFRLPDSVGFSNIEEGSSALSFALERVRFDMNFGRTNATAAVRFYSAEGVQARIRSLYDAVVYRRYWHQL